MYYRSTDKEIGALLGKTLTKIDRIDEELIFQTTDGERYVMYHAQDCCETVYIEDIIGDLDDLIGSPILMAEEIAEYDESELEDGEEELDEWGNDSHTWTFYKLATIKGYVTLRWYGSSNGYYSEEVDFILLDEEE